MVTHVELLGWLMSLEKLGAIGCKVPFVWMCLEVVQIKTQGCRLGNKCRVNGRLALRIQTNEHIAETTTPNL